MPKPTTLIDLWQRLKKIADAKDEAVLKRLVKAYGDGYKARVQPQVDALSEQMKALQDAGKLTKEAVKSSAAYRNLVSSASEQISEYSAYLRTEIRTAAADSAALGMKNEVSLLAVALGVALGVPVKESIIKRPNEKAMDFLSAYLDPSGALYEKIDALSDYHADKIASLILDEVAQGKNPLTVAKDITDQYGMALSDSMRMCRTTQLYAYRQANAATQLENADVLDGCVWFAELDGDTCSSCMALHGQVFPVGTVCDDHHNGRCVMLPLIKGEANPVEKSGLDWYNEQPEDVQKGILGEGKWQALNDGKFEFSQLSTTYENDVFGQMRGEASLKDLLGD